MKIQPILFTLLAGVALASCDPAEKKQESQTYTYCNPLDLDYGWGSFRGAEARTSADPVIVLFKDRYYLFSTHDIGGYRVSDDLVHWENRYFNAEVHDAALNDGSYVAPGVAADDNYVYFLKLNRNREESTVKIVRSADPDRGTWEVASEVRRTSDPTLFIDNGRYFIFHGLGTDQSIKSFELDPVTLTEIAGSERLHLDYITDVNRTGRGYHLGRREIWDEIDASDWIGKFKWLPCPEGSWVVKNKGKYYMQYATPGTLSIWYSDAVMVSDQPDRGYVEAPYNPVSLKAGGFIGSAGHSSVFQDRYGNWWEITTMWVGNHDPFERRLGLFPVTFDEQGRMQVHTFFGDYPMEVPQRKFDPIKEGYHAGWQNLSYRKTCTASSSLAEYPAGLASDENVRTWWSAETGNPGESLTMDLGGKKNISAIQANFGEQDFDTADMTLDYTAYTISVSDDGENWKTVVDKRNNKRTNPHEFIVLDQPVDASFVKIENHHTLLNGKFAIRDLRLFGKGYGEAPAAVSGFQAVRNKEDRRFAQLTWTPSPDAQGYLVRFGYSPDFLNLAVQVKGGEMASLLVHILTVSENYCYRIDAYNENGVTEGPVVTEK